MKNKLHSCLGRFKLQGLSGKKESLPTQIKSKRERVKEAEEEGKKGFPEEIEEEGESTKMTQTQAQTQTSEVQQQQAVVQSGQLSGNLSFSSSSVTTDNEEMSKTALSTFRAKEEEIEKKKLEVRERVQLHLGRIEEETKRLATIREELEALADPMRKEVSVVRKRIDAVNKELKPLGQTCQKKEKEYKDALDAFNDKNKEKVQLITRLMELVSESERMRMKKLDELSKSIETVQ